MRDRQGGHLRHATRPSPLSIATKPPWALVKTFVTRWKHQLLAWGSIKTVPWMNDNYNDRKWTDMTREAKEERAAGKKIRSAR